MSFKKILVTGASGFIGRHVTAPLQAGGYEVYTVTRQQADLLKAEDRKKILAEIRPDVLLHLAWYVEHGKFWHAPENLQWQEASIAFFKEARAAGVKRLVGIGTCAEYDWNRTNQTPWKESDPCHPHTPYGKAKLAVFESLNGNFAWGRIFHLFGEGENPNRLVPSIINALKNNQPAKCTSGKQIQDMLSVEDVGAAIAALVDSEITGAVNIASGVGTSVADLAKMIGRLMHKENLIELGALPDRLDTPPYMVADVNRLSREVGFKPVYSLEQRITQLLSR